MGRQPKLKYRKDDDGKFWWWLTTGNGRHVHSATQGYASRLAAQRNFDLMLDIGLTLAPEVLTEDAPRVE
jgi:uncharacterized protein YegP (UPF0339 family)